MSENAKEKKKSFVISVMIKGALEPVRRFLSFRIAVLLKSIQNLAQWSWSLNGVTFKTVSSTLCVLSIFESIKTHSSIIIFYI